MTQPTTATPTTDPLARIWMGFSARAACRARGVAILESTFSGLKIGRRATRNIEVDEHGALTLEVVVRYRNGGMNGVRSMRVVATRTSAQVWAHGGYDVCHDRVEAEIVARFEEFCAAATLTADTKTLARAAAWDAMLKTSGGTPERQEARRAWQRTISADR